LLTSLLVLLAFPVLAAALLVLELDRKLGSQVFSASSGGAILWQHLFWFFGQPEVYIVALPFFGIATEILPVFSRKPCFGYKGLVGATIAIAGLSMTVWAHHMFTTGAVLLPFFSFMSFLIAVPTGVKFFNWGGHHVAGPRSPAMAVRLGLNAGSRGELVGDGPGVARHDGRGGVDLVDEQGQGAGDVGGAGWFEGDGDGGGGAGDGAG